MGIQHTSKKPGGATTGLLSHGGGRVHGLRLQVGSGHGAGQGSRVAGQD